MVWQEVKLGVNVCVYSLQNYGIDVLGRMVMQQATAHRRLRVDGEQNVNFHEPFDKKQKSRHPYDGCYS